MYALADCNNFYATCERFFQPRISSKPIIVLSNNDGCVVARSQEAKDLGIRMGQPVFQCRDVIRANNVVVRSSNYALYEDMSRRVVSSILNFIPDVEIYSIDEVFFDLTPEVDCEPEILCRKIQSTVLQWTGVPVSIGIGPTKTLAKLANRVAKKDPLVGSVYRFPSHDLDCRRVLAATPIGNECWTPIKRVLDTHQPAAAGQFQGHQGGLVGVQHCPWATRFCMEFSLGGDRVASCGARCPRERWP